MRYLFPVISVFILGCSGSSKDLRDGGSSQSAEVKAFAKLLPPVKKKDKKDKDDKDTDKDSGNNGSPSDGSGGSENEGQSGSEGVSDETTKAKAYGLAVPLFLY